MDESETCFKRFAQRKQKARNNQYDANTDNRMNGNIAEITYKICFVCTST
jgi:hypothetical protein